MTDILDSNSTMNSLDRDLPRLFTVTVQSTDKLGSFLSQILEWFHAEKFEYRALEFNYHYLTWAQNSPEIVFQL